MAEQKDKGSSSERAPKSLLAVEPPTGGHWNPPKKILHIQGQRRSHNEIVGGSQS